MKAVLFPVSGQMSDRIFWLGMQRERETTTGAKKAANISPAALLAEVMHVKSDPNVAGMKQNEE